MDYKLLNTEITTDPLGLGYAPFIASGNDQGLADLLNRKDDANSVVVPIIPVSRVLEWAGTRQGAASSPMKAITAAANDSSSPVQGVAQVALRVFGTLQSIDLSRPAVAGMVQGLTLGGVITSAQRDALLALQNASPASRAEVLFGGGTTVTNSDISFALRGQK